MAFSDSWNVENDAITAAREKGSQNGANSPTASAAALLQLLATFGTAKTAVEIGTGTGVATLSLLSGIEESGTLTTIDPNAQLHNDLKETMQLAEVDPTRLRPIAGNPTEVLPRLADQSYDFVLINELGGSHPSEYIEQAHRLLRSGGILVVSSAVGRFGAAADPTNHSPEAHASRDFLSEPQLREDFVSSLLPLGDGLLVSVKR